MLDCPFYRDPNEDKGLLWRILAGGKDKDKEQQADERVAEEKPQQKPQPRTRQPRRKKEKKKFVDVLRDIFGGN